MPRSWNTSQSQCVFLSKRHRLLTPKLAKLIKINNADKQQGLLGQRHLMTYLKDGIVLVSITEIEQLY